MSIKLNGWQRIGVVLSVPLLAFGLLTLMFGGPGVEDDAIGMILFVPAGWLTVYALIWAVKWIRAGFDEPKEEKFTAGDYLPKSRPPKKPFSFEGFFGKGIDRMKAFSATLPGQLMILALMLLTAAAIWYWVELDMRERAHNPRGVGRAQGRDSTR